MPEGTIAKYFSNRGYGFIRRDAGGKDLFFHISSVEGLADHEITPGTQVYYEEESSPKGPRAKVVRPVGTVTTAGRTEPKTSYRFLNPYNFVRPLKTTHPEKAPLLGRCMPPPHDRYLGLSGRITCELTAVTPLFIADAEDVKEDPEKKGHYHLQFFRYEGRPAIPATSLRGSIRSAFEAATNSCFAVFGGKKRLSYHLRPEEALKLVPARVVQEGDQWYLELLPGTIPAANIGQKPQRIQYAAWIHTYDPLRSSRTYKSAPRSDYAQRAKVSLAGWEHRQACQAIVEQISHPRRRFRFWNVVQLAPTNAPKLRPGPDQKRVTGYLCITNQNIESKHDERLFFFDGPAPRRIRLKKEVRDRFEELIADYQERHADEVEKRRPNPGQPTRKKDPALSWFIYQRTGDDKPKLRDGDLVYAMPRQEGRKLRVEFIVPVSVPRVGYDQTIGERLDPGVEPEESLLHPCHDYNALCLACRTFGWVHEEAPEDEKVPIAYAGRIRFSHADLQSSAGTFDATLAILSTPKPTTTRFYLRPQKEEQPIRDGQEDWQVDYSEAARQQLRGRKVYRHHGKQLSEGTYLRTGQVRDDQNRTVHQVQKAGSTFAFTVDFENLAPIELGALLWALELEGWHHRLGMAKPLGFGSVIAKITGIRVTRPDRRYSSLDPAWEPLDMGKYIRAFKEAMAARYGRDFGDLENIRDLRALLAESPDLPVHYPRPTRVPDPEGRNYEWFVGNKRSGRNAGPRYALPLATDDEEGLPLLDKFGEPVD